MMEVSSHDTFTPTSTELTKSNFVSGTAMHRVLEPQLVRTKTESGIGGYPVREVSTEDRLFNASTFYKTYTSKVAMHLTGAWRDRFFAQLDRLLDPENWDDEDAPITEESFASLIQLVTLSGIKVRPSIGVSHEGHAIAIWDFPSTRLSVYCKPGSQIQWVLQTSENGFSESAAGTTHLKRLIDTLRPYRILDLLAADA